MLLTRFFLPILKENPKEAQIPSHILMLRAGLCQQSTSGIYSWLPLGKLILDNITNICRNEILDAGANEILMPTLQPAEIWKESGRYEDYGKEMLRIKDRNNRDLLYGPTNEELVTDIFRTHVKSYKELPLNLFHIQWKFRDELRPRFGIMRGREFLMKDSYSFNIDEVSLQETYLLMRNTYKKILERIGLEYKIVKADSGAIGGDASEEFHVLAENGEDTIAISDASEFAINTELLLNEGEDISSLEGKPSPDGNGVIEIKKGIEVGHIFQLGKIYTELMKVNVLNQEGRAVDLFMGCYGIGVSRLVAAAIEQNNDDKGILWPESIAPYEVNIVAIGYTKEPKIAEAANSLSEQLQAMGYEVIVDDRKDGYGTKMKDAELIGIPVNVIIGNKFIESGEVELKHRNGQSSTNNITEITSIFEHFKNQ